MNGTPEWIKIFNAISDGICLLDKDHKIGQCNHAMEVLFGKNENEMSGRHCWEIVHGTTDRIPQCPVLRMEKSLRRESETLAIGGKWFDVTVDPILDKSGNLERTVHIVRDVTGHKNTEESLRDSQEMLKQSQRITRIGHYTLDVASGLWSSSEMLDEIFGITADFRKDIAGWAALIHPEHQEEMRVHLANHVLQNKNRFNKKYRIIRQSDRAVRWLHGLGDLVFDKNGQPIKMFGTIQDITEQKTYENELANERERLAVTLKSIGDGVITTDTAGRIAFMNSVAEHMTGWNNAEAFGRPLIEVFHIVNEFTRKRCENPVEKVLKTGLIVELANHTMLISRDGREIVLADSGSPITNDNGEVFGVVLVFRDITEKQKMLDTIQQTQKLDSLGVLAGGIAHDFNNLLGGIFGYIDLAITGNRNIDKGTSEYLDKAMSTLNRAKHLTQQMLTFSKGGTPVRKIGTLDKTVKECSLFALSGSTVTCRFDFVNEPWSCEFDENQISQVLDNIVRNAQQAMPMGGTIDVTLRNIEIAADIHRLLKGGNYLRISIQDYGIGIPKEIVGRIFDPFFTTKQKGHGLGLATAYSIVRKHDGCVEVESEPGKGSCFHIYLPASGHHAETSASERAAEQFLGTGRVLVMDDEDFIRDTVASMLMRIGFEPICVKNGTEALKKLEHDRTNGLKYTAIILDLTIPGDLGGREVVTQIRESDKDIPVIVASGYSDDPVMAKPADFGFSASICKPFTLRELGKRLNDVLTKI